MEVFYTRPKNFTDEEINFFTTLSGIISTTVQNEQMQVELRKMNLELEQWVAEKTEELRASEERYRTLVENACESIFVLAENGDIVFANEQAATSPGLRSMISSTRTCSSSLSIPPDRGKFWKMWAGAPGAPAWAISGGPTAPSCRSR